MGPKVAICIPSHTDAPVKFAIALAALVGSSMDIGVSLINIQGAYLPNARTSGVEKALKMGAEHVLFVDSDMLFPPDGLHRLLAADKDIVGTNYIRRGAPHDSLAKAKNGVDQDVQGVVEVEQLPTGFMLIKCGVFDRIAKPWFLTPWVEERSVILGEDYYFCDKARANGLSIWMDCELSAKIIHLGEVGYRWVDGEKYELVEVA